VFDSVLVDDVDALAQDGNLVGVKLNHLGRSVGGKTNCGKADGIPMRNIDEAAFEVVARRGC
jgi:hypothetical protein